MTDKLTKITALLNDHQYHDGTSIGQKLKITRAAVWKIIKKLQSYNIPIKSVKGKGYIMEQPLVLLDQKKIKALLTNKAIDLTVLEKIDSTNDYLKQVIAQHKKPSVCIAEIQTKGKGRLGRQWHSPFGQNIYLSILYSFQKDTSELSGLSLVVALAACKAIEESCNLKQALSVKWPNDIVADGKKIAGSLIEIQAESHGFCHVIIGLGINVNMTHANKSDINQSWTSVNQLSKKYHDRNYVCAHLIDTLTNYLEVFSQTGLSSFLEEWKQRDWLVQKNVNLISNKNEFHGTCNGINEHGHLLLTMQNNEKKAFASGDTTILK